MQVDRVQVLVQQAAAGNVEAFTALVQEFAPALRLALGAHLEQPAALVTVEAAVWSAVRTRLGEWLPDTPFEQWLMQVAMEPVAAHLAQADRRAIAVQDALSHQLIEQCREALADGSELQVLELPSCIAALPEGTRSLLVRRYHERQRPPALAATLMISESELATSLAAARAACDWRGLAQPPAPGDRLIPPLIEDWLNGVIDVDSRALLAANLGRDPERARQFSRQVRVHLALGAALAPFTHDDAVALTRQAGLGAGDSGRVMMGGGQRPPASDARRTVRSATSNRHAMPLSTDTPRSSPLPWIIGGGMVLLGVMALIITSAGGNSPRTAGRAATDQGPDPTAPSAQQQPGSSSSAAGGGVLRPALATSSVQRVSLVGMTPGEHAYVGMPVELRALVSGISDPTEVQYWAGDQRLGSAREVPYSVHWTPTQAGVVEVQARVLVGAVTTKSSDVVPLKVVRGFGSGEMNREWWGGISGDQIAEALSVLTSTTAPSGRSLESQFSAPRSWGDAYLQRLSGYLIPPLDGEYVFWICGDNEAELWLSSDDTRERLSRIAVSPYIPGGAVPYRAWEHDSRQRSASVHLRAGQRYYCEALHKEGVGDDHLDVGWQLPDGTIQRPIPGIHLAPAPLAPTPVGPAPVPTGDEPVPAPIAQPGIPVPTPAPVAAGVQLVRSIDFVSSGAAYVEAPARDGERVYIDREYKLVDLPSTFGIGRLIRTRNDDDGASANPHLRFTADVAVDVYVAYATTATALPTWMQGWASTTVMVGADKGGGFRLFRRTFPAGQVVLGANERDTTGASSNYFVLVLPATQAPVKMAWKVVRAINLGGEAIELDDLRMLGHRQAEAEDASPAGSHRPGTWLSDLPWVRGKTGVGEIRRDRSMEDRPITIDGKVYAKGLGVHAPSELVYALDGTQSGFTAVVGVDDEVQPAAELSFQVWLDGQKVWDSGVMRKGMSKPVALPLAGRKEMRLVVDSNGPWDWDHADWANARFLIPGGGDGALQVHSGRRTTATFTPKPGVDAKTRTMLGTALVGTREGLSFRVKVPNGPSRVWLWLGESGVANSRQFDLTVEGVTHPGVGMFPAGGWEKLGPIEVDVADHHIDVAATVLKGFPQVMGIVVEQQQAVP